VINPNTSGTIGTNIGPAVPFSFSFASPGSYPLMLNFTTLTQPPPSTVTVIVRYQVTNHGTTTNCFDSLQIPLPPCSWPPQRQTHTGSSASKTATGMLVYPNPANHDVTVSYNYGDATPTDVLRRIMVYDMVGKPVYIHPVTGAVGNMQISVESLASGTYLLRMEENGRTIQVQRISVVH
ncbi:MAG: T9SS type A sorting domain-containing protein, partial [Bacteroidetes bacterium]|nr:T9SS type A sorting domain-containing protein [Bacteroidota bacterium]